MNNEPPFQTNLPKMRSNNCEPNFQIVIEFLCNMILSCVHGGIYKLHKYSVYSRFQEKSLKQDLPDRFEILFDKNVLFNNILRKYSNESTKKIIHHLSWGNDQYSKTIIDGIIITLKE